MPPSTQEDPSVAGVLRRINWLLFTNFFVFLPFALSHGILSRCLFPVLGIIPLSFSATTALYRLYKLRSKSRDGEYQILLHDENGSPLKDRESFILTLLDFVFVVLDILTFVGTVAFTYASHYGGRYQALAAYATIFIFADLGLHAILLRKSAPKLFVKKVHDCAAHCPNCHGASGEAESERFSAVVEVPREGAGAARS